MMASNTPAHLYAVWGRSSTDVFAAGDNGVLLHFDGNRWSSSVPNVTTNVLRGVTCFSPTSAIAVGLNHTLLRWNGMTWSDDSATVPGNWDIYCVAGVSELDIYGAGFVGSIYRQAGSTWQQRIIGQHDFYGIWSGSAGTAYVAGDYGDIYRIAGSTGYKEFTGTYNALNSVWGTAEKVFAVGEGGTIAWKSQGAGPWRVYEYKPAEELFGIWGDAGSGRFFAVGGSGTILTWDASTDQPEPVAMISNTGNVLHGVWGSDDAHVFAVGDHGTALFFDGIGWMPLTTGTVQNLYAVSGSGPDQVFAVGEGGAILLWSGPEPAPTPAEPPCPVPPTADFAVSEHAYLVQTVSYHDTSAGEIIARNYLIDGEENLSGAEAQFRFDTPGAKTAVLTVTDRCGQSAVSEERTVYVSDRLLASSRIWEADQKDRDIDLDAIGMNSDHYVRWLPVPAPASPLGVTYEIQAREADQTWDEGTADVFPGWTIWEDPQAYLPGTVVFYRVRAYSVSPSEEDQWAYSNGVRYTATANLYGITAVIDDCSTPADVTNEAVIGLCLVYENSVAEVRISERDDFYGAPWLAIAPELPFTLTGGDGLHILFAQGRYWQGDEWITTNIITTGIALDTQPPVIDALDITPWHPPFGLEKDDVDGAVTRASIWASGEPVWMAIDERAERNALNWQLFQPYVDIPGTALSPGGHSLVIWLMDRAGNTTASDPIQLYYFNSATFRPALRCIAEDGAPVRLSRQRDLRLRVETDGYHGGCLYRIWEDGQPEPFGWQTLAGADIGYTLAADCDGPHLVRARLQDSLGRTSTALHTEIILDRTPPQICIAGYWTTYLATGDAYAVHILAYVNEANPRAVDVLYNGQPTGVTLKDDGSEDDLTAGGDSVFGCVVSGTGIDHALSRLLTLQMTDLAGNVSDEWPYVTLHAADPAWLPPSASSSNWRTALELLSAAAQQGMDDHIGAGLGAGTYGPEIKFSGTWNSYISGYHGGDLTFITYCPGATAVDLYYQSELIGAVLSDHLPGFFEPEDGLWGNKFTVLGCADTAGDCRANRWVVEAAAIGWDGSKGSLSPYWNIHARNSAPRAYILSPSAGYSAAEVELRGMAADPDSLGQLTFRWLDNGVKLGEGSTCQAHLAAGRHSITLEVEDQHGGIGTAVVDIGVDLAPLAGACRQRISSRPLTVTLEAEARGGLPPYRFLWDTGSGHWMEIPLGQQPADGRPVRDEWEFTYTDSCISTPSLLVMDSGNATVFLTAEPLELIPYGVEIIAPRERYAAASSDRDRFCMAGQGYDQHGPMDNGQLVWSINNGAAIIGVGRNLWDVPPFRDTVQLDLFGFPANPDAAPAVDNRLVQIIPWNAVRECRLVFVGGTLLCYIDVEDMRFGEQVETVWTIGDRAEEVVQRFIPEPAVDDVDEELVGSRILVQSCPMPLPAPGQQVRVQVRYLGRPRSDLLTQHDRSFTVP